MIFLGVVLVLDCLEAYSAVVGCLELSGQTHDSLEDYSVQKTGELGKQLENSPASW